MDFSETTEKTVWVLASGNCYIVKTMLHTHTIEAVNMKVDGTDLDDQWETTSELEHLPDVMPCSFDVDETDNYNGIHRESYEEDHIKDVGPQFEPSLMSKQILDKTHTKYQPTGAPEVFPTTTLSRCSSSLSLGDFSKSDDGDDSDRSSSSLGRPSATNKILLDISDKAIHCRERLYTEDDSVILEYLRNSSQDGGDNRGEIEFEELDQEESLQSEAENIAVRHTRQQPAPVSDVTGSEGEQASYNLPAAPPALARLQPLGAIFRFRTAKMGHKTMLDNLSSKQPHVEESIGTTKNLRIKSFFTKKVAHTSHINHTALAA